MIFEEEESFQNLIKESVLQITLPEQDLRCEHLLRQMLEKFPNLSTTDDIAPLADRAKE